MEQPKGGLFWWNRGVKRSLSNDLDLIPARALQAGGTGSIPVTSTNFLLIARDLSDSLSFNSCVIRAHCARTVHECGHYTVSVRIAADIKASVVGRVISLARRLSLSSASQIQRCQNPM